MAYDISRDKLHLLLVSMLTFKMKKMKNKLIIYLVLLSCALYSCDDYLDVEPVGRVIPETIEDFDLLLVGGDFSIHTTSDENLLYLSADDVTPNAPFIGSLDNLENPRAKAIRWDKELFFAEAEVNLWNNPYKNIYTYNVIIENIDNVIGDNEEARKRIKAEARTMRSYEYFILVNGFAKQYNTSTANGDPGVPLVTTPDVVGDPIGRSSVQEVYDFIIENIAESINDLPTNALGITRANKATAYGLLARTYLQMGDYQNAKINADLALAENGNISDYTVTGADLVSLYNVEQYCDRYFGALSGFAGGALSDDLVNQYDIVNDMRLNGIYQFNFRANGYTRNFRIKSNHCVSSPEMYLIRAECNARLANSTVQDVLDDVNLIRRNRILNYTDETSITTKEDALSFAVTERRLELLGTGMRWFDLKRLNKESAFAKTLTHTLGGETYTLEPNSSRYVFPIPPETLNFSPNMEQNIRD